MAIDRPYHCTVEICGGGFRDCEIDAGFGIG